MNNQHVPSAQTTLLHHWIGGTSYQLAPNRTGPVWNPATGQQIAEVNFAAEADVDHAVATAKAACASWRKVPLASF